MNEQEELEQTEDVNHDQEVAPEVPIDDEQGSDEYDLYSLMESIEGDDESEGVDEAPQAPDNSSPIVEKKGSEGGRAKYRIQRLVSEKKELQEQIKRLEGHLASVEPQLKENEALINNLTSLVNELSVQGGVDPSAGIAQNQQQPYAAPNPGAYGQSPAQAAPYSPHAQSPLGSMPPSQPQMSPEEMRKEIERQASENISKQYERKQKLSRSLEHLTPELNRFFQRPSATDDEKLVVRQFMADAKDDPQREELVHYLANLPEKDSISDAMFALHHDPSFKGKSLGEQCAMVTTVAKRMSKQKRKSTKTQPRPDFQGGSAKTGNKSAADYLRDMQQGKI